MSASPPPTNSTIPMSAPPPANQNTVPVLLAKRQWTPHHALPTELVAIVAKFVQQLPEVHCEEPMDGEQYPWPNVILD